MLEKEFWGNTVENWGISILIILATFVVIKLIAFLDKKVIKPQTSKTKNKLDDIIFGSLESPILFGISLIGIWIALNRLTYPDNFLKFIDDAYTILIALNITWFFARLVNSLIDVYWAGTDDKSGKKSKMSGKMMPIVKRTILIVVWIIGIITALSNVGIEAGALLGTLGIGGIAFALAAQDTIKNIFAAFTILADKPFSIGDHVKIDSYEGTIVDIGIRSTKMRNFDKRIITFPNYKISDSSIINVSAEPMRRIVMQLALTYDTTPEAMNKAIELLKEMPSKVKHVSPKDIRATFSDYADSALVITFVYFIEKKGAIPHVVSDVNMEILRSFNNAGLIFAYPTQTLRLEKGENIGNIELQ